MTRFTPCRRAPVSSARGGASARAGLAALLLVLLATSRSLAFGFDAEHSPLPPDLHRQVVGVMERYYNFEFDAAVLEAEAIRDRDPGNPVGYFLLAECYWWQIINNHDQPELVTAFEAASTAALRLSRRRLERDKRDALALFFIGGAQGRRAILAALEGRHLEAVQASLDGRKYIKRLEKYHPEIDDAYFGLGLYNYYAAELPWFARVMGKLLLGLGGDREKGVAQMERAAEHGLFTQIEARIFLSIIYLDQEQRYDEALAVLRELNREYPENLDYYGMLAYAYRTQFDYPNAIHMLETLVEKGSGNPAFGKRALGMSRYFLGSTLKVAGRIGPAVEELNGAVELASGGDTNWLLALALLERGRAHDLQGERESALADYRQVLKLKEFRGSHDNARQYIESPYQALPEEIAHYAPAAAAGIETVADPQ